jgi:hypothetical protein
MAHDADQMGKLPVPIPNDPGLRGLTLALQGLALQPSRRIFTFTNTAWLKIKP